MMRTKEEALTKIAELEKEHQEWKLHIVGRLDAKDKQIAELEEDKRVAANALVEMAKKQRQYENVETAIATLREILGVSGSVSTAGAEATDQSVEAALRRVLKMDGGEITLERVKRIIKVKEEKRPMPAYSTLTPEGKIADFVVKGELDSQKRLKEIEGMMPHFPRIKVWNGVQQLLKDGVLIEKMEDRSHKAYMKSPDVEVEKK